MRFTNQVCDLTTSAVRNEVFMQTDIDDAILVSLCVEDPVRETVNEISNEVFYELCADKYLVRRPQ